MKTKRDFSVHDLSKFLTREALNENSQVQRILEGDPEDMVFAGEVIGPLRIVGKEKSYYILRGEKVYFSRFRAGDTVELATVDKRTRKFKKLKSTSIKMVRFPKPGIIEIFLSAHELLIDDKLEIFLLPTSGSQIKWMLRQRLQTIEAAGVVADYAPIDLKSIRKHLNEMTEKLNPVQKDALSFLIENDFKGLVQGPPGTGKTHLLVDLIRLALKSGLRIGLASLTHTAVDNALARLIHSGIPTEALVRVASERGRVKADSYKGIDISEIWASSFRKTRVETEYDGEVEYLLYAATLHTWSFSNNPPEIDILIIDEASQVPIYFHPFLETLSSRVIMFGDHKQLPPVIQVANHNLPADDIFSYEIERGAFPMLETQYRMNEGIQDWSSNRFYNGRLHPHESNKNRDRIRGLDTLSGRIGSREVNLVRHNGRSSNNANQLEASQVAHLVWALKTEGSLKLNEIGIVTPHRAQAGAICAQLQEKFGLADMQKILVDTVERFQGQEREAMILSMGVEKENSRKGDRGFLGDGRRLNVAVTRAKSRFYCIAPHALIENTGRQRNAEHLNSFLKWCGGEKDSPVKSEIG